MISHDNFSSQIHLDCSCTPNIFALKAHLYDEVASWTNKAFDQVFFDLSAPNCGWIDISIFVNGKKAVCFPISAAFDPFPDIKMWMEDIANDLKLSSEIYLELEGEVVIFHYEHIQLAQVGSTRVNEDGEACEWHDFDANTNPDTGLLYIYYSGVEDIPVVCYCKTKDLLSSLYNTLLFYASRSRNKHLIAKEWYYLDHDEKGAPLANNWKLYNTIKSPLIEWLLEAKHAYRHRYPQFKATPEIKKTVHMWAEWGDALFWHQRGGCCGNAEAFNIETDDTEIDLSDIPELRAWFNEFGNSDPCESPSNEEFQDWYQRGWELAKIIRTRLPESVDLFYEWKGFPVEGKENKYDVISILVPDARLITPLKI